MYRYSHGQWDGYSSIHLLFIGEAPGESEYVTRKPFTGQAGDKLNEIIYESVPTNLRYLITNAVMCTPFMDESLLTIGTPSSNEINSCRPHLERLIYLARPKIIIVLGEVAKRSFKKVYLEDYNPVVIYTKHPSAILQSKTPEFYTQQAIVFIKDAISKLQS